MYIYYCFYLCSCVFIYIVVFNQHHLLIQTIVTNLQSRHKRGDLKVIIIFFNGIFQNMLHLSYFVMRYATGMLKFSVFLAGLVYILFVLSCQVSYSSCPDYSLSVTVLWWYKEVLCIYTVVYTCIYIFSCPGKSPCENIHRCASLIGVCPRIVVFESKGQEKLSSSSQTVAWPFSSVRSILNSWR